MFLDAAFRLISLRPPTVSAHVVAAISTPCLFDSQLIVFDSQQYFAWFFHRDGPEQKWIALPTTRSFVRECDLSLPIGFIERGFHEHLHDDDYQQDGEIWFFGELT